MGNMSVVLWDKLWWSGLDRHDCSWMLRSQTNDPRDSSWGWSNQNYNPRVYSWGWNNQRGIPRDMRTGLHRI